MWFWCCSVWLQPNKKNVVLVLFGCREFEQPVLILFPKCCHCPSKHWQTPPWSCRIWDIFMRHFKSNIDETGSLGAHASSAHPLWYNLQIWQDVKGPILKHEPYAKMFIKIARRSQTVKLSADILVSHIFNPVCNSRLFHPCAISARGRDQDGAVEEPYGHVVLPYNSLPYCHISLPCYFAILVCHIIFPY